MRPRDRTLVSDFKTDEEFMSMLKAWFSNLARALEPGRNFYVWGGYGNCKNYPQALDEAGLYFSQAIIWFKNRPTLVRKTSSTPMNGASTAGVKVRRTTSTQRSETPGTSGKSTRSTGKARST